MLEAVWVLSNSTNHGSKDVIALLIKNEILRLFSSSIDSQDDICVEISLEGIHNILVCGKENFVNEDDENLLLIEFENQGCLPKVEKLQKHRNHDIYLKAMKILEGFYDLDTAL